jgi:hypothetical protein
VVAAIFRTFIPGPESRANIRKWRKISSLNLFFTKAGDLLIETAVFQVFFTKQRIFNKLELTKPGGLYIKTNVHQLPTFYMVAVRDIIILPQMQDGADPSYGQDSRFPLLSFRTGQI